MKGFIKRLNLNAIFLFILGFSVLFLIYSSVYNIGITDKEVQKWLNENYGKDLEIVSKKKMNTDKIVVFKEKNSNRFGYAVLNLGLNLKYHATLVGRGQWIRVTHVENIISWNHKYSLQVAMNPNNRIKNAEVQMVNGEKHKVKFSDEEIFTWIKPIKGDNYIYKIKYFDDEGIDITKEMEGMITGNRGFGSGSPDCETELAIFFSWIFFSLCVLAGIMVLKKDKACENK